MLKLNTISKKALTIIIIIGAFFIGLSIFVLLFDYIRYSSFAKIDIYIQYLDNDEEVSYVYYTYKNVLYDNVRIESYVDTWIYGHKLLGFVNPNNPYEMVAFLDLLIIPAIINVGTIICISIFVPFLFAYYFQNSFIKKIKSNNYKIIGKVLAIYPVPFRIKSDLLEIWAESNGINYKSFILKGDLDYWMDKMNNFEMSVTIYINPRHPKQYFVDYESIKFYHLEEN